MARNSSMTFCINIAVEKSSSSPGLAPAGRMTMPILSRKTGHVRKILGYLRYDTIAELSIINDLYRGDLRLYKNFPQPVMKLVSKERIGGSVKRKYDTPKTPYQRLMDSGQISEQTRKQLETVYLSLNPAQLKRSIDANRYNGKISVVIRST